MAWFLRHPDGSKRGPYASKAEAMEYMGENASYDSVVEEKPLGVGNAIIAWFMRVVVRREYGKKD